MGKIPYEATSVIVEQLHSLTSGEIPFLQVGVVHYNHMWRIYRTL